MALEASLHEETKDDHLLLWILVWSELIAFGILIISFLVISAFQVEAFELARLHLRPGIAGANTLILLVSGYHVAVAMRQRNQLETVKRPLIVAAGLGFCFVSVKLFEYWGEVRFSGDATLDSFFELYFIITGFHLMHVFFGAIALLLVAWRPARENLVLIATLWHVIDLVWLVIFPILYLA
ncbi:cytochrome c oxidase subunit 3 [Agrobacterium vitis]|uniref:cytochrome c oxidase subunit 3 n=1 Tax=Agrobacterium vitis TaxID=373 RepID=UPI0008DBFE1C|nr:cytochrome c oxidase subunit 3 [Agrobacterium vitis]MUO85293.1 cytochrome c oxidase subunit 3 family protein [Agrobacterium vitis]